jgi:hypothetical protein
MILLDTLIPESPIVQATIVAIPCLTGILGYLVRAIGKRADRLDAHLTNIDTAIAKHGEDIAYIRGQLDLSPKQRESERQGREAAKQTPRRRASRLDSSLVTIRPN